MSVTFWYIQDSLAPRLSWGTSGLQGPSPGHASPVATKDKEVYSPAGKPTGPGTSSWQRGASYRGEPGPWVGDLTHVLGGLAVLLQEGTARFSRSPFCVYSTLGVLERC